MARTITSDVGGRTLTAPVSHDLFEIVAAGMPNGDSCLGLTSDTTGAWFAYDRDTTPLVPTSTGASIKWTINMWVLKGDCAASGTTSHLFRVGTFNSTSILAAAQMCSVHGISTGTGTVGCSGRIQTGNAWSASSSAWNMITLAYDGSVGTNGTVYQWLNGASIAVTAQATAYATPLADPEWCLGWNNVALSNNRGYARDASPTTRTLIGKLAVWRTRKLSNTEVAELYAAM
jgi:hypothetical protein